MIAENLSKILAKIPDHVCLVAVSKTKPASAILEAYQAGQMDFGENRAQEILEKFPALPKDIRWHYIGSLQTNKVKQIIDKVHLIHSMDRENLFAEIEKEAAKINKKVDVLLQFHIAQEDTKQGFSIEEAIKFLNSESFKKAQYTRITGVMGMATFTQDKELISKEFKTLKSFFEMLKRDYFQNNPEFQSISMGMSGDFEIAIACGSNMIRVGSAIFGER